MPSTNPMDILLLTNSVSMKGYSEARMLELGGDDDCGGGQGLFEV